MSMDELFAGAVPNVHTDLRMPFFSVTENSALNIVLAVQVRIRHGQGTRFVIDCKRAVKVSDAYMETLIFGICKSEGAGILFVNAFALIRELGEKYAQAYEVGWLVEYA